MRRTNKCSTGNCYDPFDFMDHMFDDFWGTGLESTSSMRTDVIEEDNAYILQADLPGFNKEDISISLKEDVLTISASCKKDDKEEKKNYLRHERRNASYQRSFRVANVGPEDISASYENGVLTVTIPKKQPVEPKAQKITIS
jgi:HSP20 family protein